MHSTLRMAVGLIAATTLVACGPAPALSSLDVLVWGNGDGTLSLRVTQPDLDPSECLVLPGDTRASANGRAFSMISLGGTNSVFDRIAGPFCDDVWGTIPLPNETNLTITFGYGDQEATAEYQDILGPTTLVPPSQVRAGEQIRVQGQFGTAIVRPVGITLTQGQRTWMLDSSSSDLSPYWNDPNYSEPLPVFPGKVQRDRSNLYFIVPADAQMGTVSATALLQRAPSTATCPDLQRCGALTYQSVTFTLNVVP